jgi:hypothetical protein
MLELDKSGIAVAEYWTTLPPKAELEKKVHDIMSQAKERLERRKSISSSDIQHEINYFYESKDEDAE